MTAFGTVLALLPLAFSGNAAGLEIAHPMAIVILGGLFTSTFYTLAGVPAMYLLFGGVREPDIELSVVDEMREALSRVHGMEKVGHAMS
jgi:Cu/Ag efflux pump CusA